MPLRAWLQAATATAEKGEGLSCSCRKTRERVRQREAAWFLLERDKNWVNTERSSSACSVSVFDVNCQVSLLQIQFVSSITTSHRLTVSMFAVRQHDRCCAKLQRSSLTSSQLSVANILRIHVASLRRRAFSASLSGSHGFPKAIRFFRAKMKAGSDCR